MRKLSNSSFFIRRIYFGNFRTHLHGYNFVSRLDRTLEFFAGEAGRFHDCENVKTHLRAKTEIGHFRGEATICYVFGEDAKIHGCAFHWGQAV